MFFAPSRFGYVAGLVYPHEKISEVVRQVTWLQVVAGGVALILVIVSMAFMIPRIVRPLRMVERALARIASLDLTADDETKRRESGLGEKTEIGAMLLSLGAMRTALRDVVATVRGEVEQTASSAKKLDDLASRATDDMSGAKVAMDNVGNLAGDALRGVAAASGAIAEVTHAATLTATSATEAAEASSTTSQLSSGVFDMVSGFVSELQGVGATVVRNSEGMSAFGASVESITEFVGTIKNIASQTNLLALNAAIEAARAGEAGRGFAVVAEEVRKLAEESNVASQHVAEMIEQLQSETAAAIGSTQEAAGVISGIVEKAKEAQGSLKNTLVEIDRVNDSVQTIAAAAEEQAASSNEVSDSTASVQGSVENVVNEMAVVAHAAGDTAVVIENVAAESMRLVEIARSLEEIMESFKMPASDRRALTARK